MQVKASDIEAQVSTLLLGTTTNILNHIANLQAERDATSEALKKEIEKNKILEQEIQVIETELNELKTRV